MEFTESIYKNLMTNGTGAGTPVSYPGGEGLLCIKASAGTGTMTLEFSNDGVWAPICQWPGTIPLSITTAGPGFFRFWAGAGLCRINTGTFTGVTASFQCVRG
jgi:hypothetical protein